jgi:hypothetical protein
MAHLLMADAVGEGNSAVRWFGLVPSEGECITGIDRRPLHQCPPVNDLAKAQPPMALLGAEG